VDSRAHGLSPIGNGGTDNFADGYRTNRSSSGAKVASNRWNSQVRCEAPARSSRVSVQKILFLKFSVRSTSTHDAVFDVECVPRALGAAMSDSVMMAA